MPKTPKTLTNDEGDLLLSYLLGVDSDPIARYLSDRNHLMALFMLYAGLRVAETVRLSWTDIWIGDEVAFQLLVRAEISKNKKERMVPLCLRLQNTIKEFRINHFIDGTTPAETYVFNHRSRWCRITTRQAQRVIGAAGLKCFGRVITPHMLRHTFASRLMRCTNIRVVQELLGHASIQSTQIYTHPNGDDLKSAINSM